MSSVPIRFLDVQRMATTPPPPLSWLARPMLPRGTLSALYAPGGDGKSLLAMALAAAVAHGGELAGIQCEQGASIYLDAENGEWEIHRRVRTLGLPSSGVRLADASGLNLRRSIDEVKGLVNEATPDLLVLDSLRSMTPGMDENDTAQTARVLDPLRQLAHDSGAAILVIHHANKGGRDFRGASSIRDSVDVLWHLGRHEGDSDARRRFLANRKMRVAPESGRLWLSLDVDRGRVLIDQAEPPEGVTGTRRVGRPVRAALSDQILTATERGPRYRLTDLAMLVGRTAKDGSLRNALAALVDAELLQRDGNDYFKVQSAENAKGAASLHVVTHEPQGDTDRSPLRTKGLV